ncbi:NADH dehydrogenase [ubiquinone] 1 alpha subcomplex assembly factor 2 isoform X1 [Dendrobates tinctorius]|uniref:NADH dehydrogenase [ubiquinone] 1 alpha subcomplex assembly factor 2 isoform X1 n=1 Tax=Dendrobates tinctorius TaxID=92724 RepID=UPI003CC9B6DB
MPQHCSTSASATPHHCCNPPAKQLELEGWWILCRKKSTYMRLDIFLQSGKRGSEEKGKTLRQMSRKSQPSQVPNSNILAPNWSEEILKNEQLRKEISAKGEQLLKIDEAMSHTEGKHAVESMRTQIKGHASAPVYEKPAPTEEPTSTANTFVPGSWNPQKK